MNEKYMEKCHIRKMYDNEAVFLKMSIMIAYKLTKEYITRTRSGQDEKITNWSLLAGKRQKLEMYETKLL